ncbi:cytochrome oxidase [Allopusillimonas ginsengisoli]|nr:cytochrome oxidase [Allopusillimonas ginsengisoli]
MILQNQIWLITLTGMGLVALGFLYVISQARKPADATQYKKAHRAFDVLRRWLFVALLVLGLGITYKTLWHFPIPQQHVSLQAVQVVKVVGHQWRWELSETQIKAGVPIEFRVTSADVNHGFAIYDSDNHIVVQTQAMPGFENKILHTFQRPGTYQILCLEYCGLAHHGMISKFEVLASKEGGA